jgi:serine/threonine protein kinase
MLSKVAVSRKSRERFLRESKTIMQLSHKNIVRFLDCGAGGGAFYFVTECCNGGSLRSLSMEHGKLSCSEAEPIILDVLRGLAYAHKKGFVHRDIKPSNILLQRTGNVCVARIADFGLAKNFQAAGFSGMTTTGNFTGTFSYMPREQLTNFKYITPASDIRSVAASFYELLTGCSPRFARVGADPIEVILDGDCVPISERDKGLPRSLTDVIDRALATEVEDRYPDAEEFLVHLERAFSQKLS